MNYPYPHCPVCGNEVAAPFRDCDICPCCGVEFGLDDSFYSYEELRDGWIRTGTKWWSKYTPAPEGWDAAAQLRRVIAAESEAT